MRHFITLSSLCLMALFLASPLHAQIPSTFSYQGVLTDLTGKTVSDGTYTITIRLYDSPLTPTDLWNESQIVAVRGGIFNITVGAVKTLTLPFDRTYYLGVTIGTAAELTPRTQLTSVPYALNARYANALSPGATGLVTSLNTLTGDVVLEGAGSTTINRSGNKIIITSTGGSGGTGIQGVQNTDGSMNILNSSGPVATINLATKGITTDKLADDAVTSAKIASGQVVTGVGVNGATLHDDVMLEAGSNVTLTNSGNRITIAATGGSGGTGIQGVQSTDNSLTITNPSGPIANLALSEGSVFGQRIANGEVVRKLTVNGTGLADNVTLNAGANITLTPSGNTLTISANPGSGGTGIQGVQCTNGTLDVLNGSGPVATVNVRANGITNAQLADGCVTSSKLAPGLIPITLPPSGAAGGDLTGTYPNPSIAMNAVTSAKIADGTITGADLATGCITNTKIVDGEVTAAKAGFNFIASLDGVTNKNGNIDLVAGSNITITPDNTAKTITIAATSGGLTLPYAGTATSTSTAFAVTQNGTGSCVNFTLNNTSATNNAVYAESKSTSLTSDAFQAKAVGGRAIYGESSSTGSTGWFSNTNTTGSGSGAVYGTSSATYPTGCFNNTSTTANATIIRGDASGSPVFIVDREGDVTATGTTTSDKFTATTSNGTGASANGTVYSDNVILGWAYVSSAGTVSSSFGGITCTKTGTGLYTINYGRTITSPNIQVSAVSTTVQIAQVGGFGSTSCQVRTYGVGLTGASLDDCAFMVTITGRP